MKMQTYTLTVVVTFKKAATPQIIPVYSTQVMDNFPFLTHLSKRTKPNYLYFQLAVQVFVFTMEFIKQNRQKYRKKKDPVLDSFSDIHSHLAKYLSSSATKL